MPKSKHRKGHKQKAQNRKNELILKKKRGQKLFEEMFNKMEEKRLADIKEANKENRTRGLELLQKQNEESLSAH